jgi:uncharacterized membrane protein YkvA (DUF1232 family)
MLGKRKAKNKMREERIKRELRKKEIKAKQMLAEPRVIENILPKIDNKIKRSVKLLNDIIDDIKLLFSLVKDVIKQKYPDLPFGSLLAVLGALLYFLTPIDVLPDFLPLIGFTDDIAVILFVIRQVAYDLDKYKAWLKK